ncbi:MAG: MFS transporter [Opitutaceae bacterium]|jgi:GPH family glycoside/pentoside/hexuronide:cation symporter
MSPPPNSPSPTPTGQPITEEKDAPLKEILLYAFGNIEGSLSNNFYNLLNVLMIVALGMNPVLLGLILGAKTLYDSITDPVIAQITDHSRTRWGRRRPYILVGSVGRALLLIAIFTFFPRDDSIKSNADYAAEMAARAELAAHPAPSNLPAAATLTPAGQSSGSAASKPLPDLTPKKKKPGMIESIKDGWHAFIAADNAYHQKVTVYLLVACLLFTTFASINSVPYYALGIELCPSYDGRTRVVTYRSVVDKAMSLVAPWILPFCFLPMFTNVIDGLFWYSLFVAMVGIPSTALMVWFTKERLAATLTRKNRGPGLIKSIWLTAKNVHFLKILFLYQFIGYTNGIFAQLGTFLTIYWIFKGDALAGTILSGYAGTLATVLAFFALPLINWACKRLQKHRALRFALIWMAIGTSLKWFLLDPDHPYWQLALPFFFSLGISSVYTILPTMMADVTDIDELRNGTRREGMFGAVMAFLMKLTGTIQPVLAGSVLLLSGFDVALGPNQTPETIFNMRLMFSLIPASLLLLALTALWRYPLTREYMAEVKILLLANRAAKAAADK